MRVRLLISALVIVGLFVLVCVVVSVKQAQLVFFPGPPPLGTPRDKQLAFDDLKLATKDGETIHAWHLRVTAPRGAVIFCHGNAGNIEDRLERAATLVAMNFDVLLFDYRGYGGSSGEPSEEGTYLDAEAACDALVARGHPLERIVAFGESLGGAVAIELATRRKLGALIVEDTFVSLADMGARLYPWLPTRWILRIHYDSIRKIGAVGIPLLVIHSREDELVPFEHGEQLYRAAKDPKRMLVIGGGHNAGGFARTAESIAAVRKFLEESIPVR